MSNSRKRYGVAILVMTLATTALWLGVPVARGQSPGGRTIVLDPGHGGDRKGARGPTGSWEKDICLAVASALAEQLKFNNQVFLTRNDDYDVALRIRTATANHHRADLLISLHCGGGFQHTASGMAVYYWKPGSGQGAPADIGADPGTNRWDRTQQVHLASSRRLAMALQRTLARMAGDRKVQLQQAPRAGAGGGGHARGPHRNRLHHPPGHRKGPGPLPSGAGNWPRRSGPVSCPILKPRHWIEHRNTPHMHGLILIGESAFQFLCRCSPHPTMICTGPYCLSKTGRGAVW